MNFWFSFHDLQQSAAEIEVSIVCS